MSTPLTVTRIGHACQLIEIGETRILTDPWFTQTATYYQGEPVTSTELKALGADGAVLKPFDIQALIAQLRSFAAVEQTA